MPVSYLYTESRKMPFARFLIALIAGIVMEWYVNISLPVLFIFFAVALGIYLCFPLLPVYHNFRLRWLRGVLLLMMLSLAGSMLCFIKNPAHQANNYAGIYKDGDAIIAMVNEPLINKPKTYKANAIVTAVYHDKKWLPVTGNIIIYFDKKSIDSTLRYGSQIMFTKAVQNIQNSGNPGAFNYQRYLLFQNITGQVYINSNEYKIISSNQGSSFKAFIQKIQSYVLHTIQQYIPNKKEQGVAEALLIGYRNDLDKQLVQSYSNTGVVHIIAISGLHLGLIYGFILMLFSPFRSKKWYRFVVPVVAVVVLWLFTLLAGAVPSILRSAVTFSFIAFGLLINRKGSIYNTLAASAFCLLLFNPYLLWDVGFQLSYMAVLSISLFTKPLYNCFYFSNKFLNKIWLATCVTLAAQLLTLPVVLYNFHQFPVLFLITNLLVVFLSEIILFAILFIVIIGKWIWLATLAGSVTQWLLWVMNITIEYTGKLPFSLLSNLKTDEVQVWLLYGIIILSALWLLYKTPRFLLYSLVLTVFFFIYITIDIRKTSHQQKLIVYNVSKQVAADVISGNQTSCFYSSGFPEDITANSFTIKPGHTLFRIKSSANYVLADSLNLYCRINGKIVLFLSHPLPYPHTNNKLKADVVVITGNPKIVYG